MTHLLIFNQNNKKTDNQIIEIEIFFEKNAFASENGSHYSVCHRFSVLWIYVKEMHLIVTISLVAIVSVFFSFFWRHFFFKQVFGLFYWRDDCYRDPISTKCSYLHKQVDCCKILWQFTMDWNGMKLLLTAGNPNPFKTKCVWFLSIFFAFFILYEKYNCILMHIYSINGIPNL